MLPFFDLTPLAWAILLMAAFLIGIAKTALPGLVTFSVALFAAVLPARESTAIMLLLLLVADIFAIWMYRDTVEWPVLRRLTPPVLCGLGCGALTLWQLSSGQLRRFIGLILVLLTMGTLILLRSHTYESTRFSRSTPTRWFYGSLGGYTTMVANAGGPPMTLYFIASGMDMRRFLGTQAYFFFVVNLLKVPFQYGLGLYSMSALNIAAFLLLPMLAGIAVGRTLIRFIKPQVFTPLIITLTLLSALYLLFSEV